MKALVITAALAAAYFPAAAHAGSPGWITECPYSHSATDDPVKFPGQPGASHLHDFFGNRTTNARSTYSSMLAGTTTCGTKADTAGYWAPALYRNGVKINPAGSFGGRNTREKFYYRDNHYDSSVKVEPFPPNFKMIQGYHDAKSVADANAHGAGWGKLMWWGCSDNSVGGKPTMPANCKVGIITMHVTFPSCWDGVMVSGDEVAAGHVKFPDNGQCPAGFKHALPMLIERLEYPVGTSSSGITLASGPPFSMHADFWSTWEQSTLSSLVTRCMNGNVNCGTDP
jgi:Domain of unknown function (DUF1996)